MPTHYEGAPEEVLALDTLIKLSRALDSFNARLLAHGALEDLTHSQFAVMEALYHLGPMCQGTLSQKLLKSTGNMTLVIDNLEKHGYVLRVRSTEDRRMVMIELTVAGREKIARIFPVHAAFVAQEMSMLSPAEQAELGRLSRKLGKANGGPQRIAESSAAYEEA